MPEITPDPATEPEAAMAAYFTALGRFIHHFSRAEADVQILLWLTAQTPPHTARAIFSGTKIAVAKQYITRIREARRLPMEPGLKRALDQLGVIASDRNDIIHYGAKFDDSGSAYVSNSLVAHLPERVRTLPVSPDILDDMTADLETIGAALYLGQYRIHGFPITAAAVSDYEKRAAAPWRYKSPQQGGSGKTPRNSAPE